jgi:uncharacterized protein with gpF-like domain
VSRRSRRIARHVTLTATMERALYADMARWLDKVAKEAARRIRAGHWQAAGASVEVYAPALQRALTGRLMAAGVASAELVAEELTGAKAAGALEAKFVSLIEVARAAIRRWLADYAAEKVRKIAETTRRIIRRAIVRGNEASEAPREMAKRVVEATAGEIGKRRALTIARTETGIAAAVGSNAAADASGLDLDKEWGATEDHRTRPAHAEADGQTVDKDGLFIVGGEPMRFPKDPNASAGNVINCRCVALWIPRIPE